jgi:hypothetical protein
MQEVLNRKIIIAQQYGIWLPEDADLYDFIYLSNQAKKQKEDKAQAIKEGKVWI